MSGHTKNAWVGFDCRDLAEEEKEEYISRTELINSFVMYGLRRDEFSERALADGINLIANACSAADVPPVVYGQWEPIINAYGELEGWICKRCGTETKQKSNYCPRCGCRMDGGSE